MFHATPPRCLTVNKVSAHSGPSGWTASSPQLCSHTRGAATRHDRSRRSPSIPTCGPACTPPLAGEEMPCCTLRHGGAHSNTGAHITSRLLKACGSRLTEKLLEGAPTEDTLVLIERQTGWHIFKSLLFFCFCFHNLTRDPPKTPLVPDVIISSYWGLLSALYYSLVLPLHAQTTLAFWLRLMTACATLRHGFVTWNVSKVSGLHLISRQSWERPICIDTESLNALLKTYDKKSVLATSSWILTSLKSQHSIQAVSDKYKVIKVLILLKKNIWSFQRAHNGFIIAGFPLLVSRDLSESGAEILHHFSYKKKLISNRWCIHYIPVAIVLGIQGKLSFP